MPADYKITVGYPQESFWEEFIILWQNSLKRSPFEAPGILQFFARETKDELLVFQYRKAQELRGVVIFKRNHCNLTFLSDMKTDVNFFVLHRESVKEEWGPFFKFILKKIKKEGWTMTLNNQPDWAPYMPALNSVIKNSGLFYQNIPYSVCPYVEGDSSDEFYESIHSHRELRYRENRLRNQEKAVFEVLTDDTELDKWVEEFCDAHELRWADTPTHSHLNTPEARQFLKNCFTAWNADGLLVRFAVIVKQERIGFVVALRESQSLVHHSTTFHPRFSKSSPGKALIHFMAEWMRNNGYQMLDFGDGNEPYKYTVADKEHHLNRIFVSSKYNLLYIGKTHLIKFVRNHPEIYSLYQNRLKPLLGAS